MLTKLITGFGLEMEHYVGENPTARQIVTAGNECYSQEKVQKCRNKNPPPKQVMNVFLLIFPTFLLFLHVSHASTSNRIC